MEDVFLTVTAWFCKCHAYNPEITLDFKLPLEMIPSETKRECLECSNTKTVKIITKEIYTDG